MTYYFWLGEEAEEMHYSWRLNYLGLNDEEED